jgi:hypothetical protein|nr:MAG TPA: hypothetical protein [Caudoviricetes sp.]
MEKENTSLATELIRELKSTSKRWFIAFIVVLSLWFATIGGFIIYLSLPVEETVTETVTQDADDNGNNNYVGGDNNVGSSDGN